MRGHEKYQLLTRLTVLKPDLEGADFAPSVAVSSFDAKQPLLVVYPYA